MDWVAPKLSLFVGWTRVSPATGVSQAGAPCRRKFANFVLVFFSGIWQSSQLHNDAIGAKISKKKGCGGQKFWERAAANFLGHLSELFQTMYSEIFENYLSHGLLRYIMYILWKNQGNWLIFLFLYCVARVTPLFGHFGVSMAGQTFPLPRLLTVMQVNEFVYGNPYKKLEF